MNALLLTFPLNLGGNRGPNFHIFETVLFFKFQSQLNLRYQNIQTLLLKEPAEQAVSCRISARNLSKFWVGNLNFSAGKISFFLTWQGFQKVERVFVIGLNFKVVNALLCYHTSSQIVVESLYQLQPMCPVLVTKSDVF